MVVEKAGYGWVDKDLTFTEALTLSSVADQSDPPFKALEVEGDRVGDNANVFLDWNGTGMVQLNDNDGFGKSAALYFKVGDNWRMKVGIATDNNGYFTDNLKPSFVKTDYVSVEEVTQLSSSPIAVSMGFPDTWFDTILSSESVMAVAMTGGDYLSIDIDEEYDDIYRFRLKINGSFRNKDSPEQLDANTYIGLIKLEHYEELGSGDDTEIDNDNSVLDPFDSDVIDFDGDLDVDPVDDPIVEEEEVEEDANYSVLIVLGSVMLIIFGSYYVLTRGA